MNIIINFFRIAAYATASTADSIYIIGGAHHSDNNLDSVTNVIVEFKNDKWEKVGNLANRRWGHRAITSGSLTMIVGGREGPSGVLTHWANTGNLDPAVENVNT